MVDAWDRKLSVIYNRYQAEHLASIGGVTLQVYIRFIIYDFHFLNKTYRHVLCDEFTVSMLQYILFCYFHF